MFESGERVWQPKVVVTEDAIEIDGQKYSPMGAVVHILDVLQKLHADVCEEGKKPPPTSRASHYS
jgi:hypothetical protein